MDEHIAAVVGGYAHAEATKHAVADLSAKWFNVRTVHGVREVTAIAKFQRSAAEILAEAVRLTQECRRGEAELRQAIYDLEVIVRGGF